MQCAGAARAREPTHRTIIYHKLSWSIIYESVCLAHSSCPDLDHREWGFILLTHCNWSDWQQQICKSSGNRCFIGTSDASPRLDVSMVRFIFQSNCIFETLNFHLCDVRCACCLPCTYASFPACMCVSVYCIASCWRCARRPLAMLQNIILTSVDSIPNLDIHTSGGIIWIFY